MYKVDVLFLCVFVYVNCVVCDIFVVVVDGCKKVIGIDVLEDFFVFRIVFGKFV